MMDLPGYLSKLQFQVEKLKNQNIALANKLKAKIKFESDNIIAPILKRYYDKGYEDGRRSRAKRIK